MSDESLLCLKKYNNRARISGTDGVTAQAALTYDGLVLTSVALATTGYSTVAFLGTNKGTIKKVRFYFRDLSYNRICQVSFLDKYELIIFVLF